MRKSFSEIFQALYASAGFKTQTDAAAALGIPQQLVSKYLKGNLKGWPELDTAVKMASGFRKILGDTTLETLAGTEMKHASRVGESRPSPYGLAAYPTEDIESALAAVSQAEASLAQAKTALKQARKQMGGKKAGQH